MKKTKNTFSWEVAEKQFIQNRIVEFPMIGFRMIGNGCTFDIDKKTMLLVDNIRSEQIRTVYSSICMMLDRMDYVERVQGISPKIMTCEDGLNEILPIVRSPNTFKPEYQLYDNGNYGGSYITGTLENDTCGLEKSFESYGRISEFMLDIEDLKTEPILDRGRVWHGIRCVYEKNICLLKYRITKKIITKEIKEI